MDPNDFSLSLARRNGALSGIVERDADAKFFVVDLTTNEVIIEADTVGAAKTKLSENCNYRMFTYRPGSVTILNTIK